MVCSLCILYGGVFLHILYNGMLFVYSIQITGSHYGIFFVHILYKLLDRTTVYSVFFQYNGIFFVHILYKLLDRTFSARGASTAS
jgi:hypothetical protein